MTPEQFCYWLQGYFELHGVEGEGIFIDVPRSKVIRDHLQTVFKKVTPEVKKKELDFNPVGLTELETDELAEKFIHSTPVVTCSKTDDPLNDIRDLRKEIKQLAYNTGTGVI